MRIKISVAVFYVLLLAKLSGFAPVAGWSWWIVSAPLWAYPVALMVFYITSFLALATIRAVWGVR